MTPFARSCALAFLGAAPPGYDVERFLKAAGEIARSIEGDRRLKAFFASPAVPLPAKKGALARLAESSSVDDFGARLLEVVLEKRRLPALGVILAAIREQADVSSGVVAGRVRVASPVSDVDRAKIAEALARAVGRRVRLEVDVDEKILGGFVAKVGSEVFDASVRRAVELFQERSKEGAGT